MKYWFTLALVFFSNPLWASDFSFIIQDQAQIIAVEERKLSNYRLALGTYKKTRNRWQPENSRRLSGDLTSYTLTLPDVYNAMEVFDFYRQQLSSGQTSILFFCESRDCGSSNVWANNHFNKRQLYGLDRFQFYGVYQWQLDADSPIHYITLYAVRRGNDRVYAQLEVFLPDNINEPLPEPIE